MQLCTGIIVLFLLNKISSYWHFYVTVLFRFELHHEPFDTDHATAAE